MRSLRSGISGAKLMMPSNLGNDLWTGATAYERFMGRWSRDLARVFVQWLGIDPDCHWLEIGCGTGALTARICEIGRPASVVATDPSEQFIAHARGAIRDQQVDFQIARAGELPTRVHGYDAIVSSLALNFLPDPIAALREMRSLAAEGGVVAACVWDYAGGMQFLRRFWDAAIELDPAARPYDEGERFPICSPVALEAAFSDVGLPQARVEPLDIEMSFEDFNDYWTPFVDGPGPAPAYLSSLSVQRQQDLARRLAATLPRHPDHSITLTARAWAVAARKSAVAARKPRDVSSAPGTDGS